MLCAENKVVTKLVFIPPNHETAAYFIQFLLKGQVIQPASWIALSCLSCLTLSCKKILIWGRNYKEDESSESVLENLFQQQSERM